MSLSISPQINEIKSRERILEMLGVLKHPLDDACFRVVRLARRSLKMPIVVVSFPTSTGSVVKHSVGLDNSTDICDFNTGFCHQTLQSHTSSLVVPDALDSALYHGNSWVTGGPHARFVASTCICVRDIPLGALTIMHTEPNAQFGPSEQQTLCDLAGCISDVLQAKLTVDARYSSHFEHITKQCAALECAALPLKQVSHTMHLLESAVKDHDSICVRATSDTLSREVLALAEAVDDSIFHMLQDNHMLLCTSHDGGSLRSSASSTPQRRPSHGASRTSSLDTIVL